MNKKKRNKTKYRGRNTVRQLSWKKESALRIVCIAAGVLAALVLSLRVLSGEVTRESDAQREQEVVEHFLELRSEQQTDKSREEIPAPPQHETEEDGEHIARGREEKIQIEL